MKYDLKSNEITVQITLMNSDLEITGADRNDLEVDFSELRRNAADEIFDISFENNNLKISQKSKKLSQFTSGDDFTVKITVPKTSELNTAIDDLSGDISVSEIGSLSGSIKSKSGDIKINSIDNLQAEISSIIGNINECKGSLFTSTVSGDIEAGEMDCSHVRAKSVSGDMNIKGSFELKEDAVLNTVSGDINIDFKKYSGESLIHLKTVSGDIEMTGNKPEDDKVRISTVKGDFSNFNPMGKDFFKTWTFGSAFKNLKDHIKDVSENNSVSEIKESKKDDQNIQTILNLLAEGKITADEAEKLIKVTK